MEIFQSDKDSRNKNKTEYARLKTGSKKQKKVSKKICLKETKSRSQKKKINFNLLDLCRLAFFLEFV